MHSLHSSKTKQNHKKTPERLPSLPEQRYIKHTLDKEIFDSDLKNMNWKEILEIERGEMLTIPLRLSTKNSMRYLINMHLSKIINPRRKTLKKPLDHYWNT